MKSASTQLAFLAIIFLATVARADNSFVYFREFQLQLDEDYFRDSRGDGIATYLNAWADAADTSLGSLNGPFATVRTEQKFTPDECGIDTAALRMRKYIWGDLEGLVTLDLKSGDSLSRSQAEEESYKSMKQYSGATERQVELDVFPCEADYAADTRIFLDSEPDIDTCGDIDSYYHKATTKNEDTSIDFPSASGVTYNYFMNGTYAGHPVLLAFTMFYDSLDDAIDDRGYEGGEFSFTLANDDSDFADEQTTGALHTYHTMLDKLGSVGDYPCDASSQEVDLDFFDSSGQYSSNDTARAGPGYLLLLFTVIVYIIM